MAAAMFGGADSGGEAGEGQSKRSEQARSQFRNKHGRFARRRDAAATPTCRLQSWRGGGHPALGRWGHGVKEGHVEVQLQRCGNRVQEDSGAGGCRQEGERGSLRRGQEEDADPQRQAGQRVLLDKGQEEGDQSL